METISLEHIPSDYGVYATLFKDVSNVEFLQSQLVQRNPEFEYAFIDASSVRHDIRLRVPAGWRNQLTVSLLELLR
jgi:hypothetical protein